MTIIYNQNFETLSNNAAIPGWNNQASANYVASSSSPLAGSISGRDAAAVNGDIVTVTGYSASADMELRFDQTFGSASGGNTAAVGSLLRSDATAQNAYLFLPATNNNQLGILFYKLVGGAYTQIGGNSNLNGAIPFSAGQNVSFRFRIQGSTLSAKAWPYGGTEPASFQVTANDSSITAPGYFGFYQGNGAANATGNSAIDNITLDNLTSGSIVPNLSAVYISTTAQNELILNGSGWSSGTTFSVSGGSGASITSAIYISATQFVLKLIPGSAAGALTISDSNGLTVTINVLTGSIVQPNSASVQLKGPVNISAQEAVTITSGPGGNLFFVGDSIRLRFNVGTLSVFPDIIYQVDRDPVQRISLSVTNPFVNVTSVYNSTTAVKAYQHRLRWWYAIFEGSGSPQPTIDKWNSLLTAARFAGVDLPGTNSLLALPPLNPNVIWPEGDSLTESVRTLYTGSASDQTVELPNANWSQLMADRLGFDLFQTGYGGTGVTVSGSGNVPAAPSSIGYCYNGAAFTPPVTPLVAILYHGTNDSSATSAAFQAAYVTTLNTMRSFAPNVIIFAVNPHCCNGSTHTNRFSDIQAAIATSGLSNVFAYDAYANAGISQSADWADTVGHMNVGGHDKLALYMESIVQTKLTSLGIKMQTSSGGSTNVIIPTITKNGSNQPVLTWAADPLATGYLVSVSTSKTVGATLTIIASLAAGTLTYTDTAEPVAANVYYAVTPVH